MNGRVEKSRRSSRAKLSKASQERLLDAALSQGAGTPVDPHRQVSRTVRQVTSCTGHAQDCREESAEGFARVAPPEPSRKRQLDATSDIDPLPAKRARSTRTDTQRPGVEVEEAEQTAETLQQPRSEQVSPTTLLRKRQIESDDKHQPKRVRLTRKNLAVFNKMVKKGKKTSASAPPDSTVESSTTKTTSTTTSGFAMKADKNGILDPRSSKPPTNLEDIHKRHARSRGTASPTQSEYEDYVNRIDGAPNKATMVFEVGGRLLKKYDDKRYKKVFNQAFTGFPKDVGFNNGLFTPQPDFAEGLEMREFRPFPVDEHVSGAVLYNDDPYSLTLPHVAGEWKGRGKDMEEARLQSAYDGAALVYARNQALSYIGKPDPPGYAEVTTFTTDGTNINFFAHYAAPSEDGTLEYHQYPVTSANVKKSYQEHNEGRRGLRNEQDYARKQSYVLRDQLKEHGKNRRGGGLHPIAEGVQPLPVPDVEPPDTTNAYEDEDGYEVIEQQPVYQPTPPTSSKPKHGKTSSSRSLHSIVSSPPPAVDFASGSGHKRKTPSS
ncbi:hypothetical protein B0T17DRAFT_493439 [Bombardia bombarda]|uniref:Uncharacterized protein n=1 Tax=Bombardia bombarda TaxID=252184 RepID=A0AA39WUW4_9PEZI|nr:hypothetical protein B0T17DRAFT_493439 [Bombardia bombarda]